MCPLCFGVDDSATVAGVWSAVATLFGVTVVVIGAIARFAIGVWRNQDR